MPNHLYTNLGQDLTLPLMPPLSEAVTLFFRATMMGPSYQIVVRNACAHQCSSYFAGIEGMRDSHWFGRPGEISRVLPVNWGWHPWRMATPESVGVIQGYIYRDSDARYVRKLDIFAHLAYMWGPNSLNIHRWSYDHLRANGHFSLSTVREFISSLHTTMSQVSQLMGVLGEGLPTTHPLGMWTYLTRSHGEQINQLVSEGRVTYETIIDTWRKFVQHMHCLVSTALEAFTSAVLRGFFTSADWQLFTPSRAPVVPTPTSRPLTREILAAVRSGAEVLVGDPSYTSTPGALILKEFVGAARASEYLLSQRPPANPTNITI